MTTPDPATATPLGTAAATAAAAAAAIETPAPVIPITPAPATPAPTTPEPAAPIAAAPVVPAIPEKYELKLPDGSDLKPGHLEKIASYAKEQGLSNEQAQKVLERDHQLNSEFKQSFIQEQEAFLEAKGAEWIESVKSDKEIGGDKANESVEGAHRFVEKFGSPEVKKFLNDSKLGNHPEVVRLLSRAWKQAFAEDKMVQGGRPAGQKKSTEEKFYGSTN